MSNTAVATESKLKKNMPLLIVLVISGASIYLLPYLRYFYYDAFRDAFMMTNEETGLAGTYFGLFGALSYLIGGLISDKISIKILLPGSMIVSGLLGLFLLTSPAPMTIAYIHGVWGVTSLMTFWPALIKTLRLVGNSDEQGKVFGIFEGGRGVTNASVYAVTAFLFGTFMVAGNPFTGIRPIIIFYSVIPTVLGVLNIYLLRNVVEDRSAKSEGGINVRLIGKVLSNPRVWIISLIIFCGYTMNMSNYYIAPYASATFSVSLLMAGIMSSSSQYIRPFAAIGAGILGDKINASKVMILGLCLTFIGMSIIYFTPVGSSMIPILVGLLIVFASMFITQAMHFALLEEDNTFPPEASGTVIGILCTIGYLPEAIVPYVGGIILDNYASDIVAGYQLIFLLIMGVTAVGIAATFLWMGMTKARRAEILANKKAAVKA